jgi:hypothetical protein
MSFLANQISSRISAARRKAERLRAKLLASSARYYPPERVQFAVLTTLFRLGEGFIDDPYETLGSNGLSQKGGVWRHLTRKRPYDARNDDDSCLGKTIPNSLGEAITIHGPRHLHVSHQHADRIAASIQLPQSLVRIAGFLHMKTGASQDFGMSILTKGSSSTTRTAIPSPVSRSFLIFWRPNLMTSSSTGGLKRTRCCRSYNVDSALGERISY